MRSASANSARAPHARREENILASAASASPHGLMIEQAGQVVYANRAFAKLVGARGAAELLGRAVSSLARPGQSPRRNGSKPPPEYQSIRGVFRRGRTRLALTVVRDVTENKRMERQLREAQKMEALGRLVGGVAHDFNNVLAAVMLYGDLLGPLLPAGREAAKYLAEIRQAAEQGAGLVRQLLSFARPQPTELRHLSLNTVVSGLSDMLRRLVGEDVHLALHCHEPLGTVLVDPCQLQQIIVNLVMNARDALRDGGVITLSTAMLHLARPMRRYPGLRRGNYVGLTVSDTGCGMDAATRARLFEPFFTTKPQGKGTGLGMSTVYSIVRHYGGTVAVESEPGRGTRVTILLPQARTRAVRETESAAPQLVGHGHTVLLAEDDDAIRAALQTMLEERGYEVLTAGNDREAAALARQHQGIISLLISDIVMPGQYGSELAQEMVRHHPGMRVLFITGYPEATKAAASGAVLLSKPFSRELLARKLQEVLDRPAMKGGRKTGLLQGGKERHDHR